MIEAFRTKLAAGGPVTVGNPDHPSPSLGEYLGRLPVAAGGIDCDGFLHLSDVRNLLLDEVSFSVEVIQDPNLPGATSIALLGPGDAGQVVPIVEDKGYLVRFDYDYRVPFGTDPPFSLKYSFRAASTPVIPALSNRGAVALGMVLLGAAGLALRVGRARPA